MKKNEVYLFQKVLKYAFVWECLKERREGEEKSTDRDSETERGSVKSVGSDLLQLKVKLHKKREKKLFFLNT